MKYSVFFSSQVDGMGFVTVALTQTSQDSIPIWSKCLYNKLMIS